MRPTLLAALLACSACAGPRPANRETILRAGRSGLINPLLDVESSAEFVELKPFVHKVQALIDKHRRAGDVAHVSLFFRDLNNGPLYGIDETARFAPASLLKVPLMMAVLKQAESDPQFLQRPLVYATQDVVAPSVSTGTLIPGREYSLDELLKAMISRSDNNAALLLVSAVDPALRDRVYQDLGLSIPNLRNPYDFMTVREYATFFRILYNASYLSRPMSQKALEFLAGSDFTTGLVAGVRPGLIVAHKFGERILEGGRGMQLHDCGIVYAPETDYLLCIMTRGDRFDGAAQTIRDLAKLVDSEIDAQLPDRPPRR